MLQNYNVAMKYKVEYSLIYFLKRRDLAIKISKLSILESVCGVCVCVSRKQRQISQACNRKQQGSNKCHLNTCFG